MSWLILAIVVLFAIAYLLKNTGKESDSTTSDTVTSEPSASTATDEQLKTVFERCQTRGIDTWPENIEQISKVVESVLATTFDNPDEIRKVFEKSKELHQNQRLAEEKAEIEKDFLKAKLIGKDKYLYGIMDRMGELEREIDEDEQYKTLISDAGMKPKTKSPVASAAVTGTLLGTSAGVAAGSRTQQQNEQSVDTYNQLQSTINTAIKLRTERQIRMKNQLSELGELIQTIKEITVDDSNRESYLRCLDFDRGEVHISESSHNLVMYFEAAYAYDEWGSKEENEKWLDFESNSGYSGIDGSIKLTAKYKGTAIGTGYYCCDGFGKYPTGFGYHEPGLGHRADGREILIGIDEGWNSSWDVDDVTIEAEPFHIWAYK